MKLLLDQGLPRSAVQLLTVEGIEAIHVAEISLESAADERILEVACESAACVVTLDADFHAILARTRAVAPSVIRIRIEGLRAGALCAIIRAVISQCQDELVRGAVATVTPWRIRVRALPLP